MVRYEQLVTRLKDEGAQHCVYAGGGVGYEGEILGIRPDKASEFLPRSVEQALTPAQEEVHGIALQLVLEFALRLQHGTRASAK